MPAEPDPLSLMPGPCGDRIEVRAGHDDVVLVAGLPGGDHVLGLDDLRRRVGDEVDGDAGRPVELAVRELVAEREREPDDRDVTPRLAERRAEEVLPALLALVEEDDSRGSRRGGVVRLDGRSRTCRAGSARCCRAVKPVEVRPPRSRCWTSTAPGLAAARGQPPRAGAVTSPEPEKSGGDEVLAVDVLRRRRARSVRTSPRSPR